jgi:hypothetical protein
MSEMQFIKHCQREGGLLHVAERAVVPDLPEWRKMPFCRNGGLNLYDWDFVSLNPLEVYEADVCGTCRRRLAQKKIEVEFAKYGVPHTHRCLICQGVAECLESDCKKQSITFCSSCGARPMVRAVGEGNDA